MQPGSLLEGVAGSTAVGHKFAWECFPLSIINHRNQSGRVGVLAGGGAEHLNSGRLGGAQRSGKLAAAGEEPTLPRSPKPQGQTPHQEVSIFQNTSLNHNVALG